MYRSFRARNFRCFADLQVRDIARINLIAGLNNVGKTALLEALLIHSGAPDANVALGLDGFRGLSYGDGAEQASGAAPWASLFSGFAADVPVELVGQQETGRSRLVRLRTVREPAELARATSHFSQEYVERPVAPALPAVLAADTEDDGQVAGTAYLGRSRMGGIWSVYPSSRAEPSAIFFPARGRRPASEDAERYGKMEVIGRQDAVRDALKLIESRLQRLAVVVVANAPVIHGDIGVGRLMPLPLMGEGMARLFSLVVGIGNIPKGVVLVDEIENGLHHSVLYKVWRAIAEVARQFDVQVFATTHSYECITAAHKAFAENLPCQDDFRLHRLERVRDEIVAVTYDREALGASIEMGLEVR